MSRQLAFDLPARASFAPEDFLPARSNRRALNLIRAWPDWPDKILLIVGPAGSGKSHLAAIWAAEARAASICPSGLSAALESRLGTANALLLEDVDRSGADETALFHFLNAARTLGAFVVITARRPPELWGLSLPDLLSRLRQAPVVSLDEPDEDLMRALLLKLFTDRQLAVDAPLIDYLTVRIDRSFDAARSVVQMLDAEALRRGRRLTRQFAAEVLREHPETARAPSVDRDVEQGELPW